MKHLIRNLKKCKEFKDIAYKKKDHDGEMLMLKLALLETCGWIEETMDNIYLSTNIKNRNDIEAHIEKIYSFYYETFKKVLVFCIGRRNVKSLEQTFSTQELQHFKSALSTLKNIRNSSAHTHYMGSSQQVLGLKDLFLHVKTIQKSFNKIIAHLKTNNLYR